MKDRTNSRKFRELAEKVGEAQAKRIYDTKAEYQRRYIARKRKGGDTCTIREKKTSADYSAAFYLRLADQYETERASA